MCLPTCKPSSKLTGNFSLSLYKQVEDVPADIWNEITGDHFFYAQTPHLKAVESTSNGQIKPYYLIVQDGEIPVAAIYFQRLKFSFKNAVKNFQWKNPFWKSLLNYLIIRILSVVKVPLLQSGNIFFTGDSGIYFRYGLQNDLKQQIISYVQVQNEWAEVCAGEIRATMFSNLFYPSTIPSLEELKFGLLDTEPDLWMGIPVEWNDFSDYLASLTSKYRVRANKIMQTSSHLVVHQLSEMDLIKEESGMINLYRAVASKADFNMAWLKKGYFSTMKQLYKDSFEIIGYYEKEKLVGFTSAFYVNDTCHAHYIGIDYTSTEQKHLYNRMLLDFVKAAIQRESRFIHFGRTATEIKTTIGAQPIPMHGYIRLENRLLNQFLPILLKNFGAAQYTQRHPFKETQTLIEPQTCAFLEH